MFDSDQKSTGTGYTTTLPIMAFCPVAYHGRYLLSGRLGRLTASWGTFLFRWPSLAARNAWAWVDWKKSSRLTIPSVAIQDWETK